MDYIKATKDDIDHITDLVHETIQTIYPKYYPKAIVDFYYEHHCRENIAKDIENGNVGILVVDGKIAFRHGDIEPIDDGVLFLQTVFFVERIYLADAAFITAVTGNSFQFGFTHIGNVEPEEVILGFFYTQTY